ncbi:acetate--CoA ligase family protein [Burkholderia metallica]
MIRELRTWPPLEVYRRRPKADVDALAAALVAFSRIALQLGKAEINPLFVLDGGHGVRAADGVAVLA